MAVTKYPRLYVGGKFSRIVYPVSLSITENIIPLSTASITLRKDDTLPARSWLELFTPYGSAGMYRVRSPRDAYGMDTTTAELEHMISEVGDYLVKEEISKMMAAKDALTTIFKYYKGGKWKLGDVSGLKKQVAVDVKYDRVLDAMLAVLEQIPSVRMSFDFSTSPWTINIVNKGTSVTAEGRLSRNVTTATVTYDDSELVTRLWYKTFAKDKNKTVTWASRDADTLKTYGVVEGTVSTDANMTDDELNAVVNTYLEEHKKPRVSISIQAAELSQITGESMDKFTIGKLMRLALPDYNTTVEDVINSIVWQDVYNSPRSMTVNLGAEEDTVVTFLHNLDSTGSGGGGGGKNKKGDDEAWSEYIVEWDKADEAVVGMVAKQNKQGEILEQAGLTLNSKGVLIYAKDLTTGIASNFVLGTKFESTIEDTKKDYESKIEQESKRISLVVEGTGKNAKIKAASIVLGINEANKSEVHISADHVFIGDEESTTVIAGKCQLSDVTADYIGGKIAEIAVLTTRSLAATGTISCSGYCYGDNFVIGTNSSGAQNNKYVSDAITDLQITVNSGTVKLQKKDFGDSDWVDVGSFSRATSLSGTWSGGEITMSANADNVPDLVQEIRGGEASWSNRTATIKIYAYTENGQLIGETGREVTATYNLPKTAISLTRTKKSSQPTTDGTLSAITSNGWYQLDVTAAGVTKTWKVQVSV